MSSVYSRRSDPVDSQVSVPLSRTSQGTRSHQTPRSSSSSSYEARIHEVTPPSPHRYQYPTEETNLGSPRSSRTSKIAHSSLSRASSQGTSRSQTQGIANPTDVQPPPNASSLRSSRSSTLVTSPPPLQEFED
jgi:hypothetical protein